MIAVHTPRATYSRNTMRRVRKHSPDRSKEKRQEEAVVSTRHRRRGGCLPNRRRPTERGEDQTPKPGKKQSKENHLESRTTSKQGKSSSSACHSHDRRRRATATINQRRQPLKRVHGQHTSVNSRKTQMSSHASRKLRYLASTGRFTGGRKSFASRRTAAQVKDQDQAESSTAQPHWRALRPSQS